MRNISISKIILILLGFLSISNLCLAQTGASNSTLISYPNKPIKFIIPFSPGSASDILARTLGEKITTNLGQPVLIENKPGAGGVIASSQVAKSDPDGYTLLVVSAGHVVNPYLINNLPFDTLKDFSGVVPFANLPSVLVISPKTGIQNLKDFLIFAKNKNEELNYVSGGIGSASHVNAEKFLNSTGLKAVHIPLKGAPDMVNEIMAGRADFGFIPITAGLTHIRSGNLSAIAVSSHTRSTALPQVPTISELGFTDAEFNFWIGLLAPSKTPIEIVKKINLEIQHIIQTKEVSDKYISLGAESMPLSPNQFDAFINSEYYSLGKVMKKSALKSY